jgi:hypothetical protein
LSLYLLFKGGSTPPPPPPTGPAGGDSIPVTSCTEQEIPPVEGAAAEGVVVGERIRITGYRFSTRESLYLGETRVFWEERMDSVLTEYVQNYDFPPLDEKGLKIYKGYVKMAEIKEVSIRYNFEEDLKDAVKFYAGLLEKEFVFIKEDKACEHNDVVGCFNCISEVDCILDLVKDLEVGVMGKLDSIIEGFEMITCLFKEGKATFPPRFIFEREIYVKGAVQMEHLSKLIDLYLKKKEKGSGVDG